MKNIKQFQNAVCHEKKLKDHIDRLIQSNESTGDKLNVFFSGALSSFLTTIMALFLDDTVVLKSLLIRIPIIIGVFLGLWVVIAKWLSPIIMTFFEQRKLTTKVKQPDKEIVDYFNSAIVLSSLEIKDAVAIVTDENQDADCRRINAVLVTSEYIACINFITKNVEERLIRFLEQREIKSQSIYINEYSAMLVFDILYKAGEALLDKKVKIKDIVTSELIVSDLNDAIERFREYRNSFKSSRFMFESENH